MNERYLREIDVHEIPEIRRAAVDATTLEQARTIVDDVRQRGAVALREHAERFGDITSGQELVVTPAELKAALDAIDQGTRGVLERTARRIERFASAQRESLHNIEIPIPGGVTGHRIIPIERAGCYAPGGRFPLPSSVLMTAITARAAGVATVWVASPGPTIETMAAAAIAGVDGLLRVGGAQAIAALAVGIEGIPAADVVVGPGNRWVTAAKQLVSGLVRIDMLAGPSELVVLADESAAAETVAADLLAQAEHDVDALPILVTTSRTLIVAVEQELRRQLVTLSTAEIAREALTNGFVVHAANLREAVDICNRLAAEHLEVLCTDAEDIAEELHHFGSLFVGRRTAEVLGDYGAGPNHTLPTGGTARSQGGLSVFNFLKIATWMRIDDTAAASALVEDAIALGELEGLSAHARSAALRRAK